MVTFLTIFSLQSNIKNLLLSWDLLPKPEKITELYFTEPSKLPSTYTPNQPVEVNFTVHNVTGETKTYHYDISASPENDAADISLSTQSFTLQSDETRAVKASVSPPDLGARIKFNVVLIDLQQNISFWTTKQ